jgi:hypothetical protein
VQLTVASSEAEAAVICGLLESQGIPATYDKGGVISPPYGGGMVGDAFVGRQQVLIRATDLARARELLASQSGDPPG